MNVPAPVPAASSLVLVAGGDVELARAMGQALLKDPSLNPLAPLAGWLRSGDIRFVNLEGPLSDQKGETMSPRNPLVFTGPPVGAEVLARAGIDLVSTANNHAWDYGKSGLLETLVHLDRAGVKHVGTGASLAEARAPVVMEKNGWKIGFLAATGIWNQGELSKHPGREHVAEADASWMIPAVRALRERVDVVAVSYHGGEEYREIPLPLARKLHTSLIDAGADVILGHHPHVLQGVGWHRGRPIFYSLGNLRMSMHRDHPWTGLSLVARV
ncbi:MAG: CapA family protein, partial [Myxococcales bacterium]|nr:CapA family protein [Myxococcales bacterium]